MVDPRTRAVVAKGYPDEELMKQHLAPVNEAIQTEIDKIESVPRPKFCEIHHGVPKRFLKGMAGEGYPPHTTMWHRTSIRISGTG